MAVLFGPTLASSVVQGALSFNTFAVTRPWVAKESTVCFLTGRPLGYYASWPLFALSHHFLVWLAADKVYPDQKEPFRNYAILGDDIVITFCKVAQAYSQLLDKLGVTISTQKSLTSKRGCLEFAKRFMVHGGHKDFSPVSLRAAMLTHHPWGLCAFNQK